MGLDQYLIKAKKLSQLDCDNINNKTELEIDQYFGTRKYVWINDRYIDDDKYKDIKPLLSKCNVTKTFINLDEIKEAYKIPEDWDGFVDYLSSRTTGLTFKDPYDNTKKKSLKLDNDEIKEKFTYDGNEYMWICESEVMETFCKEYDLDDDLREIYYQETKRYVENTGYHKATANMIHEINHFCDKNYNESSDDLFYYIWF